VRRRWDDEDWSEDQPGSAHEDWFGALFADGLVTDVLMPLKSGKEASVHLCRGGAATGHRLVAVKAYHPRERRAFRNDAVYKNGRVILRARDRRAVEKKTAFGRDYDDATWVFREWEHLETAHRAGVGVPHPLAIRGRAIVMEYLGDQDGPAPQLKDVAPDGDRAGRWLDALLAEVEGLLRVHLVHADLSPYNVLVWDDAVRIIDLPQAVDARTNRNAAELLARDLRTICRHFARAGAGRDPERLATDLWRRYRFAAL
jgi:RIO kinase 1